MMHTGSLAFFAAQNTPESEEICALVLTSTPRRPFNDVLFTVWMSVSANDAAGKFFAIFLPISAFVALGLDHSVANM